MPRRAGEAATTLARSSGRGAAESSHRHATRDVVSRRTGRSPISGLGGHPSQEAFMGEILVKASEMRSCARRAVSEEMRLASSIALVLVRTSPGPSLGHAVSAATDEKMGLPSSAVAA